MVKAPGALTISAYCTTSNINLCVTPDLKCGGSALIFVKLGDPDTFPLGGSALAQTLGLVGGYGPDLRPQDISALKQAFYHTQALIAARKVLAGQDVSDGGLLVAALEMAFAGCKGLHLNLQRGVVGDAALTMAALFDETPGLLLEVAQEDVETVLQGYNEAYATKIGEVIDADSIRVTGRAGETALDCQMTMLRDCWEKTSFALDLRQAHPVCVATEQQFLSARSPPQYHCTFAASIERPAKGLTQPGAPKVCILREEGSNGDREMAVAFQLAGCRPFDVTMADLLTGKARINDYQGIAFVGGFSYADVLDAGTGWAAAILFNDTLRADFDVFRKRPDTFSLGICNGCQLMARLGWVEGQPGMRFRTNTSGRFESRFVTVSIRKSAANKTWMRGMEGAVLGIWAAHGEGRPEVVGSTSWPKQMMDDGLVPLCYTNDAGEPTGQYPFCPNGAPEGIASFCSEDGRHLCMMPHPERCVMGWQWPWMPPAFRADLEKQQGVDPLTATLPVADSPALSEAALMAPWHKMFCNIREWYQERN